MPWESLEAVCYDHSSWWLKCTFPVSLHMVVWRMTTTLCWLRVWGECRACAGCRVCSTCRARGVCTLPHGVQFRGGPLERSCSQDRGAGKTCDTLWDSKQGKIKLLEPTVYIIAKTSKTCQKGRKKLFRTQQISFVFFFQGKKGCYCAGETSAVPLIALQEPLAKEMSPLVAKTIGTQLFFSLRV